MRDGLVAGTVHDVVRLATAQHGGEAHHHLLARDQPACGGEVLAHARGVHDQPFREEARLGQGAMGQHHGLAQHQRLGLPGAGAALQVLRHGGEHLPHQRMHPARLRQDVFAAYRVALLRHGAAAAAAGDVRLVHLGHLGLHHEHDVGRDLGQRAAEQAAEGDDFRQPVARHMPGDVGRVQPEFARQLLMHGQPLLAQRGQRAGRTAELQPQRAGFELVQPLLHRDQRRKPDGHLVAEGDGQGVLEMGAPGHHRAGMGAGHAREALDGAGEFRAEQLQRLTQLQHHGAVHDVLGGGAPMGPSPRFRPRQRRELLDQAHHRITRVARGGGECRQVQAFRARGGGDGRGGLRRHDAQPRLGAGQRGLHIQHGLQEARLAHHGAHGVGAVERAQDGRIGGVHGHGGGPEGRVGRVG